MSSHKKTEDLGGQLLEPTNNEPTPTPQAKNTVVATVNVIQADFQKRTDRHAAKDTDKISAHNEPENETLKAAGSRSPSSSGVKINLNLNINFNLKNNKVSASFS